MSIDPRRLLLDMFQAAVNAAAPALCVHAHLPLRPKGRTIVVGGGKAAAAMAAAVEAHWDGPLTGMVVTRYGHAVPCEHIEVIEASHPEPDEAGDHAAHRMLELVAGLSPDDLVIALLSGGGSALLTSPLDGLTLGELQHLNAQLLKSGAAIDEINCVRRHVSALAGGRLAAACHPARVVSLSISDVPGDDPVNIASGPTVTCADALAVLRRFAIDVPASVTALLTSGRGESVKPGDPRLTNIDTRIIATPQMSLEAAAEVARHASIAPYILGDRIESEARHLGTALAGIARHVADHGQPFDTPCVLLSGGETTVTVRHKGRGGRNSEFLLALGIALQNHPRIFALAGDTDGVDGTEEIAGAIWSPDSAARAAALGLRPRDNLDNTIAPALSHFPMSLRIAGSAIRWATILRNHDAHPFFERLGDGVITGPTMTNVNDFRAILILDRAIAAGS